MTFAVFIEKLQGMATPRYLLVDPNVPLCYHVVSRCVRQAWLCGIDKSTGNDYSHRKAELEARLHHLGQLFSVDILSYSIMSNHFHLVVYFDPKECERWTDQEVVDRWNQAFFSKRAPRALPDSGQIRQMRDRLGSLSCFMQHLKQPIARRANLEDGTTGHFFDQRFYSGALLDDEAIIAAMAYVDLNPIRARIARTIDECDHTSLSSRLRVNSKAQLKEVLRPVISGVSSSRSDKRLPDISNGEYLKSLRALVRLEGRWNARRAPVASKKIISRAVNVRAFHFRRRAYGLSTTLSRWLAERNMHPVEDPLLDPLSAFDKRRRKRK